MPFRVTMLPSFLHFFVSVCHNYGDLFARFLISVVWTYCEQFVFSLFTDGPSTARKTTTTQQTKTRTHKVQKRLGHLFRNKNCLNIFQCHTWGIIVSGELQKHINLLSKINNKCFYEACLKAGRNNGERTRKKFS